MSSSWLGGLEMASIVAVTSSGVRVSDLITALSLATDLGLGQPPEHMMRAATLSMRIGRRLGLDDSDLATLYDVSVLTYVGCPVFGDEGARLFGDDIDFRARALEVDLAGFPAMIFMLRRAGAGTGAANRVRQSAALMGNGGRQVMQQMANHCAAAGVLADGLGLHPDVRAGIEQSYARWDGRGVPRELSGEGVSLAARISQIAEAAEVLQRAVGTDGAVDLIRARSGTQFDPRLVDVVDRHPEDLMGELDSVAQADVVDLEPVVRPPLDDDELDDALAAIGDFCDLRCSFFAGHAVGTARIAEGAAIALGLDADDVRLVRRAALVHDVGRFGVPGQVWGTPGPLGTRDRERMQLHSYYVERIFSRPEPLRRVGLLAATHHERLDGTGYHRHLPAPLLARTARLLAAADAFHAMTQHRPHRPARDEDAAARELRRDAASGRLDAESVEAVIATATHRRVSAASRPGGLTTREIEVLRELCGGRANKAIAARLGISTKTVGNHVEHIYTKLGVTNRASATLAASRLGLLAQP